MSGTPVITTPIRAHLDLDLPSLMYAEEDEQFLSTITHIQKMCDTPDYDDLSRDCYLQARLYSLDNVGTAYERMFEEIVNSEI